jgi:hypothetical protein
LRHGSIGFIFRAYSIEGMKSMLRHIVLLLWIGIPLLALSQPFKHKYYDPNVNVNDVIREADAWFEANGTGPGNGMERVSIAGATNLNGGFIRSGDRSLFDPQIAWTNMRAFKDTQPTAKASGMTGHWTFQWSRQCQQHPTA